jgi:5-methylcytosine-specific restriction endonuclease McrA
MVKHRVTIDELYRRDKGICGICLEPVRKEDATREHIIPRSEGGAESPSNLVISHADCNMERMSKKLRLKPVLVTRLSPEDLDDYERNLIPAWQLRKRLRPV